MSELVSAWPFEGHLQRCRGFDSLHATLVLLVVVLAYMLSNRMEVLDDRLIDPKHSEHAQAESEDA